MATSGDMNGGGGESGGLHQPVGNRELIVITREEAGVRAHVSGATSAASFDLGELASVSAESDVVLRPLFGVSEDRVRERVAAPLADAAAPGETAAVGDPSTFYHVDAPDHRLDELAERLRSSDAVVAAYVKPPGEPPTATTLVPETIPTDAPPATPTFVGRQGYLDPAPGGINARFAWTVPGGGGANVNVIDLEWGWRFDHEDLGVGQGGVISGTATPDVASTNPADHGRCATCHGTAVVGEIGGDRNAMGITGICPDAHIRAVAFSQPTASAIRIAADALRPGDIMLLEIHRAGPRFNFAGRDDQQGYIAIEWWQDDFLAIQYATSRGVIVVEAAGNGRQNLDDPIYDTRPPGFPSSWTNPFRRSNRDCCAILVGAGAPPPGTHGRNHGADRSRLDFSNFGTSVDAQGWGREVTTTGYGSLQGGGDHRQWYTDTFSGTSSASPIVVGALGCVQGVLRSRGRAPLTPLQARAWLRSTGSPQQDGPNGPATQRIGNRPDLGRLIPEVVPSTPLFTGISRSTDKLDVFVVGTDRGIYTAAWQPGDTAWRGWWRIAGGAAAPFTAIHAVSRSQDKLDVFAVGTDRGIYTASWQPGNTTWQGWRRIAGGVAAPGTSVTGVSRSTDKLDAFAVGTDQGIYTAAWQPGDTAWRGWTRIAGGIAGFGTTVHAVSRSTDKLDVFAVGSDHGVYTAAWQPGDTAWRGWWRIGTLQVAPGTSVHAVSRSADKIDIFAVGADRGIYTAAWEPGFGWRGWWRLLGGVAAPGTSVYAVSRSTDKLDVFAIGSDRGTYTAAWEPGAEWRGWWRIANGVAYPNTSLFPVARSADKLDVFVIGTDKGTYTAAWRAGDTWRGWWRVQQGIALET